ncbi:hypothetical protein EZS27_034575, partial [termite gut metagenome]
VEWMGNDFEPVIAEEVAVKNQNWSLSTKAEIIQIYDPQQTLNSLQQTTNHLHAKTVGILGNRTVFVRLKQGKMIWWQAVNIQMKEPVSVEYDPEANRLQLVLKNNSKNVITGQLVINGNFVQPINLPAECTSDTALIPEIYSCLGTNRLQIRDNGIVLFEKDLLAWNLKNLNACYVTVNMDSFMNAPVTGIFKNRYLSPRSPYTTLQTPVQGVGEWCHPDLTYNIDDTGFRKAIKNKIFTTPPGIPFHVSEGENNIAFTTLWDNYPDSLVIPLSGNAFHAYLLMAGTTNPMQCHIPNGIIRVEYKDGDSCLLQLINPDNWAPIEQNFYLNGLAFTSPSPLPYRLMLKTGDMNRDAVKVFKVKHNDVNKRTIDGGAGIMVDIPLDASKELKEIKLTTVANELVIGVMGITLMKEQKTGVLFADSEMKRFPQAWRLDHGSRLYFGYSQGLGCLAMLKMWKQTGDRKYYDYVEQWADSLINEQGEIHLYEEDKYNIDFINSGKIL